MAELGIDRDRIEVLHSDTDLAPFGGGTIGSRSAQLGGSATFGAARDVIETAKQAAAASCSRPTPPTSCSTETPAGFHVPGRRLAPSAGPISDRWRRRHQFKPEGAPGRSPSAPASPPWSSTSRPGRAGAVAGVGRRLPAPCCNRHSPKGRCTAGWVSPSRAALYEEMVYDEDGVPRTATFADYPRHLGRRAAQFETHEMETPSPWNPLGVKGIGESGTVVATPAVQSAVLDALRAFGVEHLDLPYTPERVWRAIAEATARPNRPTHQ